MLRLMGHQPNQEEELQDLNLPQSEERQSLVEKWRTCGAWDFMTAKDTDGEPIIWTKDEQDVKNPMKLFPSYPFLRNWYWVLDHIDQYNYVAMADKCRQMLEKLTKY